MLQLEIVKDFEYGEDACVTTLYEITTGSRSFIMSGDYYLNKIDEKITGFLYCLNHLGIKYEITNTNINEDER